MTIFSTTGGKAIMITIDSNINKGVFLHRLVNENYDEIEKSLISSNRKE